MEKLFLIKYGEISLKGDNRDRFFKRLKSNIKKQLPGYDLKITIRPGRFYLYYQTEDEEVIKKSLSHIFGITGFSKALRVRKTIEEIKKAALKITKERLQQEIGVCFKIEAKRVDKSFKLNSYEIACNIGAFLQDNLKELKVDVNNPDWILAIEIREEAYLYADVIKGPGGLPVYCAGKGLLLLSGGIDSPVAGYLMAKRGLFIDAVYFHTPPFTSEDALIKVKDLTGILSRYIQGISLIVIPFTDVQLKINQISEKDKIILLIRSCMMKIADIIARKNKMNCLVTGESLSQVASQTPQSIHFTGSYAHLPVFRPLIGYDKVEIINMARKIGTYKTSILPYPDCCTLFAPPHPCIKPDFMKMQEEFMKLEIDKLLEQAIDKSERFTEIKQ